MRSQATNSTCQLDQPQTCLNRRDDEGFWNSLKAWHWYPLHLCLCVAFLGIILTRVDGHAFRIGDSTYFNHRESGLYQAEVTGFVSAALVLLRLVAEIGSSLIIWRLVFLLLDKTGITLVEICRVVDMRLPMLSGFGSMKHVPWSLLTLVVVVLVWPSSIAAPFANSSIQWIPSTQLAYSSIRNYTIPEIQTAQAWDRFLYPYNMAQIALRAAIMGVKDADYAFIATQGTQRQYLYLNPLLPSSSLFTAQMPYFEVSNIKWRTTEFTSEYETPSDLRNASMQDNAQGGRDIGTLGFWTPEKWDYASQIGFYEQPATVYEGKRNVSILVGRIQPTSRVGDDDPGTNTTQCLTQTRHFGHLPLGVSQYNKTWLFGGAWAATECFIVAEVTMKIGATSIQPANITLTGAAEDLHIVSPLNATNQSHPALLPDWAILPTLDMMTDVLQQLVWLDVGKTHRADNADGYLAGMLTVAYHATRSALVFQVADANTTVTAIPAEPMVRALVNRGRLYGWLGLNATLAGAALLLGMVQFTTAKAVKVVRDPTLVALTMNMDAVCHHDGDGLCNAVALRGGDKKLGRVVWDRDHGGACRRVRFAGHGALDGDSRMDVPLLDLQQGKP